jgi:predicted ATP-dependent Lon-type protease
MTFFSGRVVRKDLTKQLKEGANVPVYVLVTKGATGQLGLYRFETQMIAGNGKHSASGLGSFDSLCESVQFFMHFETPK